MWTGNVCYNHHKQKIMKTVRTNCIEAIVDARGKVVNYRMTFPIPREYANEIHESFSCVQSRLNFINGRAFVELFDKDFEALWAYKCRIQMIVADTKIRILSIKRDNAMMEYTHYLKTIHQ